MIPRVEFWRPNQQCLPRAIAGSSVPASSAAKLQIFHSASLVQPSMKWHWTLLLMLQDPMLHRPDSPTYAKDPAFHLKVGDLKVEDSLGAVVGCGSIWTPSPTPRSAPDPAISLLILAPSQSGNRIEAPRSPKPETEMVAPPSIWRQIRAEMEQMALLPRDQLFFWRQTTGNGNDGATIAL